MIVARLVNVLFYAYFKRSNTRDETTSVRSSLDRLPVHIEFELEFEFESESESFIYINMVFFTTPTNVTKMQTVSCCLGHRIF